MGRPRRGTHIDAAAEGESHCPCLALETSSAGREAQHSLPRTRRGGWIHRVESSGRAQPLIRFLYWEEQKQEERSSVWSGICGNRGSLV